MSVSPTTISLSDDAFLPNFTVPGTVLGHCSPRVFIIRRESSRMRRFRDLAVYDLVQGVDPFAFAVESIHEMHLERPR